MLDQRWRETVALHARETAVHEAATGRSWTFAGLAAAADAEPAPAAAGPVYPTGHGISFLLAVLRAWRAGGLTCPLEPGQPPPEIPPPPAGIAHLKLTSGTTGAAKCVAFTAAQLAADADAIVATMGLRADWPNLGVISLAHSYGFSNLVLPLLLHGIPLVLVPAPLPAMVLAAARAPGYGAFTLPAVPAMWRAWHEAAAIPPGVRLAISAGAPLPLALEAAVFAAHGLKIHNFLGASECGGIAYDAGTTPRTDASFVGHPLRGVKLGRTDEGCLTVTGPAVGETYWPQPDDRLGAGHYRTGDLVEFAPDGGLFLRGRADDLINVAGRKVAPETIELVLRQHPGVRECLVLGVPADEQRGEAVAAIIEADPSLTAAALREFALTRLPAWQVPRHWRLVAALAPNGRGKLSRAEWRTRLGNNNF
jgi:long-chain acyl-CoA synthetase